MGFGKGSLSAGEYTTYNVTLGSRTLSHDKLRYISLLALAYVDSVNLLTVGATRKHHAAVHDGTCYMSEPCRLHDFQHIRHAF